MEVLLMTSINESLHNINIYACILEISIDILMENITQSIPTIPEKH